MANRPIVALFLVAGCAKATYVGPIDGQPAYKIDCSELPSCRDKARELCGGDFEERTVVGDDKQEQPAGDNDEDVAIVAVCK
jgi:hypothetical protein